MDGERPAKLSRLAASQVSRAPPPDSGVVPFSKEPRLANQERADSFGHHNRAFRPFRAHRSASQVLREGNSERTTAVTLPTGLADTRSQPLQRKEGLSTKGRGRVGRFGRLDFGFQPFGVETSSTNASLPDLAVSDNCGS